MELVFSGLLTLALTTPIAIGGCALDRDGVAFNRDGGNAQIDSGTNGTVDASQTDSSGNSVTPFPYMPSNFDPDMLTPELGIVLDCGESRFDSATMMFVNWCNRPTPTPVVVNGMVVLPMIEFRIESNGQLRLFGDKPVILAVYGNVTIDGLLDASARADTPGPGGSLITTCSNGRNGRDGSTANGTGGGGGGGGFGTDGANGGNSGDGASRGDRGSQNMELTLIPLVGGCDGGDGGSGGGDGGAGGGGIQISAASALTVSRTIASAGGGGAGGTATGGGGGGGGTGGGILLEGSEIELTATASVTANGGGGGGGGKDGEDNPESSPGAEGLYDSTARASGGDGGSDTGGDGGDGGARQGGPNAGGGGGQSLLGGAPGGGGGGGGGSVGRIRLNGDNGCNVDGNATISPPQSSDSSGC